MPVGVLGAGLSVLKLGAVAVGVGTTSYFVYPRVPCIEVVSISEEEGLHLKIHNNNWISNSLGNLKANVQFRDSTVSKNALDSLILPARGSLNLYFPVDIEHNPDVAEQCSREDWFSTMVKMQLDMPLLRWTGRQDCFQIPYTARCPEKQGCLKAWDTELYLESDDTENFETASVEEYDMEYESSASTRIPMSTPVPTEEPITEPATEPVSESAKEPVTASATAQVAGPSHGPDASAEAEKLPVRTCGTVPMKPASSAPPPPPPPPPSSASRTAQKATIWSTLPKCTLFSSADTAELSTFFIKAGSKAPGAPKRAKTLRELVDVKNLHTLMVKQYPRGDIFSKLYEGTIAVDDVDKLLLATKSFNSLVEDINKLLLQNPAIERDAEIAAMYEFGRDLEAAGPYLMARRQFEEATMIMSNIDGGGSDGVGLGLLQKTLEGLREDAPYAGIKAGPLKSFLATALSIANISVNKYGSTKPKAMRCSGFEVSGQSWLGFARGNRGNSNLTILHYLAAVLEKQHGDDMFRYAADLGAASSKLRDFEYVDLVKELAELSVELTNSLAQIKQRESNVSERKKELQREREEINAASQVLNDTLAEERRVLGHSATPKDQLIEILGTIKKLEVQQGILAARLTAIQRRLALADTEPGREKQREQSFQAVMDSIAMAKKRLAVTEALIGDVAKLLNMPTADFKPQEFFATIGMIMGDLVRARAENEVNGMAWTPGAPGVCFAIPSYLSKPRILPPVAARGGPPPPPGPKPQALQRQPMVFAGNTSLIMIDCPPSESIWKAIDETIGPVSLDEQLFIRAFCTKRVLGAKKVTSAKVILSPLFTSKTEEPLCKKVSFLAIRVHSKYPAVLVRLQKQWNRQDPLLGLFDVVMKGDAALLEAETDMERTELEAFLNDSEIPRQLLGLLPSATDCELMQTTMKANPGDAYREDHLALYEFCDSNIYKYDDVRHALESIQNVESVNDIDVLLSQAERLADLLEHVAAAEGRAALEGFEAVLMVMDDAAKKSGKLKLPFAAPTFTTESKSRYEQLCSLSFMKAPDRKSNLLTFLVRFILRPRAEEPFKQLLLMMEDFGEHSVMFPGGSMSLERFDFQNYKDAMGKLVKLRADVAEYPTEIDSFKEFQKKMSARCLDKWTKADLIMKRIETTWTALKGLHSASKITPVEFILGMANFFKAFTAEALQARLSFPTRAAPPAWSTSVPDSSSASSEGAPSSGRGGRQEPETVSEAASAVESLLESVNAPTETVMKMFKAANAVPGPADDPDNGVSEDEWND